MYKVPINRQTLQNHWQYDWWKYLLGVVLTSFLWYTVTVMTRPRTPDELKVDIYLVGEYYIQGYEGPVSQKILEDFPDLKEINFYSIPFNGNPNADIYSQQKLTIMVMTQTGDLFIMDRTHFNQLMREGSLLALDDLIDEEIRSLYSQEEWESVTGKIENDEGEPESEEHIYGIPMRGVTLLKDIGFPTEDKVIGVMGYSRNMDKAIEVMKWIIKNGRGA